MTRILALTGLLGFCVAGIAAYRLNRCLRRAFTGWRA